MSKEELDKVRHDVDVFGNGFMKDGKHVPLKDVFVEPAEMTATEVSQLQVDFFKKIQEELSVPKRMMGKQYKPLSCIERLEPRMNHND